MNKEIKSAASEHLFKAILTLDTVEECYKFFEDLCTVNELLALSQRYEVARRLKQKHTFSEISRVNRTLNYGNDGYELVFERLAKDESERL